MPKKLNINSTSYPNNSFYNDYVSYIRFITPYKKLGVLERELKALIETLEKKDYDESSRNAFEEDLKLIVCSYVSYLGKYSREFAHKEIRVKRLYTFLQRVENIYGLVQDLVAKTSEIRDDEIMDSALSASEYLSYAVQNCLLEVNIHLKGYEDKYSETIVYIVNIVNSTIAFCKKKRYARDIQ